MNSIQFRFIVVLLAAFGFTNALAERPNVLFIAVDDLRVELNCYGQRHVQSPNIDRLAADGTLFERAYCQQTVCNPSRASVLTGLRPDTLKVWDLPTHFRANHPNIVTLPQLFMQNGYHAQGIGKVFHNWRQDQWKGDAVSWSVPAVMHYASHGQDKPQISGELPPNLASGKGGLECRDVPDNAYYDGRVADAAVEALKSVAQKQQPFFLAVGFWKPHTPFNAPKKYWDLYDRAEVVIPQTTQPPSDVPEIALTGDRIRSNMSRDDLREMHHGHLAAISYLDGQVGRVLDALDESGMRDNTIVVFWSDHGLHLGEHGLLRKTTVFELDARVPLIIKTPGGRPGQRSRSLVELLDLYPTLAELCGLKSTPLLEGKSLKPVLQDPQHQVRSAALTQSPRPNYLRGKMPQSMGYSIRTESYRYTEWREFKTGLVQATELYDHKADPGETQNVAALPDRKPEIVRLSRQLNEVLGHRNEPHPVSMAASSLMLRLQDGTTDPAEIDFAHLPRIEAKHVVISDVRDQGGRRVNQHAYLSHFDDRFWAIWSDGPGLPRAGLTPEQHRNAVPGHDRPGTRVSYSVSPNGTNWSVPQDLSGPPRIDGFGWIARGLWVRDGQLLALASHFNAPGYAGKGLSLEAFRWDQSLGKWVAHGTVLDDTLNNFPPKLLPDGEYMMSRRDHRRQVSVMIGGRHSFDSWKVRPLAAYNEGGRPEEPYWYILPDGKNIVGLIRDNGGSKRLLRTCSTDNGRTWSKIVRTNFPDATSKFFVHRTSRGYYVLVSNSNPKRRDPLTLAVSRDGLVFDHLFHLIGGRHVDYPHIIEHDENLYVAFSGAKQTMEVLRLSLDDLDEMMRGSSSGGQERR